MTHTHTHLTLDLTSAAMAISEKSQMLGLAWGNLIHQSIAVIQPTTRLCSSRVEAIPAGKTASYAPALLGRGIGAGGPVPPVRASATLDYTSNELDATVCLTAAKDVSGRTTLGGCSTEFLATIDPDRAVEGVVGEMHSEIVHAPRDRAVDSRNGAPHGPVRQWTFTGMGTPAAGAAPQVTLRFNRIRVISSETSGVCRRSRSSKPDACTLSVPERSARWSRNWRRLRETFWQSGRGSPQPLRENRQEALGVSPISSTGSGSRARRDDELNFTILPS